MSSTATPPRVTVSDILRTPAALRRAAASLRRDAQVARRLGWPAYDLERIAGELTVAVEQRIRLDDPDRHTRAMAQAEAAGITGLRDVWTMSA